MPPGKIFKETCFSPKTASLATAPDDTGACLLAISSWGKECAEEEEEEEEKEDEEEEG